MTLGLVRFNTLGHFYSPINRTPFISSQTETSIRFAATVAPKSEVSDTSLFNQLPRPVQMWLKIGIPGKRTPDRANPPLGFEHLFRGMLLMGAKAASQVQDLDQEYWPCKPAETATLKAIVAYLHGSEDMEDEDPRSEHIWEVLSNAASRTREYLANRDPQPMSPALKSQSPFMTFLTNTAAQVKGYFQTPEPSSAPQETVQLTPELRQFLTHFYQTASSALPTTEELFHALFKRKRTKDEKADKDSGFNYVRGAMQLIRSQYEEMNWSSFENEVLGADTDEAENAENIEVADEQTAADVANVMDEEDLRVVKNSPYGAEYGRWWQKLQEIQKLPEAQRAASPKQIAELEQTLRRFRTSMPEDAGDMVSEVFPMVYNHAETLLELPWNKPINTPIDLKKARQILDADHYGMERAKGKIMDYLAVEQRRQTAGLEGQGKIILFVGDPGVGKTSLTSSIAKALEVPLVPVALGGMKDAAELRGERRGYIQAQPGALVKAIKESGVMNPVILLDELEKIENLSVKSALLEALDPKQNKRFRDNFVGEYDLSRVRFVATANSLEGIPGPLMDRLEIINLRPYTTEEKLKIATLHLLPKILRENHLTSELFAVSTPTILEIIDKYAPESGVRQLEKRLNSLAEKRVFELSQGETPKAEILPEDLGKYFEAPPFVYRPQESRVGRVNILSGSGGGDLLPLDVTLKRVKLGKNHPGDIKIASKTGGLGRMAKESIDKMLAYVDTASTEIAKQLKVENFLKPGELVKVHADFGGEVSSGPCDGPSAGLALATGLISSLAHVKVKSEVAMTGTLSHHGDVGAIGGLMSKLMAAARAGMKTVLVPKTNLSADGKQIEEGNGERVPIPDELFQKLKIIPVTHFNQAIPHLFEQPTTFDLRI